MDPSFGESSFKRARGGYAMRRWKREDMKLSVGGILHRPKEQTEAADTLDEVKLDKLSLKEKE